MTMTVKEQIFGAMERLASETGAHSVTAILLCEADSAFPMSVTGAIKPGVSVTLMCLAASAGEVTEIMQSAMHTTAQQRGR